MRALFLATAFLIVCAASNLGALFCHAATIFNNLGGGPSWDTISGMALLAGGGNDIDAAVHFTPSGSDFRLQQVRAPIEYVGGPNVLDVLLLNDGGALGSGTKPGSVLESIRLTGQMTTPETLLTVNSSRTPASFSTGGNI